MGPDVADRRVLGAGDIAAADAEIERLASLAHSFRNPLAKWHLRRCQAVRALLVGRYEQAVALSEEATAVLPPDNFIAQFLHFAFMSSVDADRRPPGDVRDRAVGDRPVDAVLVLPVGGAAR